ncbi:MAG: cell division protein FtsQ/DivIB [Candidatus Komeilibacteria bacterium]
MNSRLKRGQSVRQPAQVDKAMIRAKVKKYALVVLLITIIYILGFSSYYEIKYIQIVGNEAINTSEIEELIWQRLDSKVGLFFPRNNFWLLSTKYLLKHIKQHYTFEEITIDKKYPDTISLRLQEKQGKLVWQSTDKYYVLDAYGVVTRQLQTNYSPEESHVPLVVDLSAEAVDIGKIKLNPSIITTMIEASTIYDTIISMPILAFDHLAINNTTSDWFKIVTSSGIEIHLNDQTSAAAQLDKLAKVLAADKIDLTNIGYINLRIADQVIYK